MAAIGTDMIPDIQILQKAIECGDVDKAKEIVSQLAALKTNLKIESKPIGDSPADEIEIKIYLEDKYERPGGFLQWKVHPSATIKELKERLEEEQDFPQQVQRWIIGRCIRRDADTLIKCGIKSSGASVYVYLLSANKVGLTKEQFENRKNQPAQNTIYDVPQHTREQPRLQTPPIRDEPFELDFHLDVNEEPVVHPRLEIPPEDILPSISQVGWRCETCTFANEPTRPGCQMCGADRPADYVLPQMPYKMTDKERKRLDKVEEEERLAREISEKDPQSLQVNLDSLLSQQEDVFRNTVPDFAFGPDERINQDPLGTAGLDDIDPLILQELVLDVEEGRHRDTRIPDSLAPVFTRDRITRVLRGTSRNDDSDSN